MDKNNFVDLPQQKRGSRRETARKVIRGITYSLIVLIFLLMAMICICLIFGGKIEFWGGYWSAKSLINDLFILVAITLIVNMGGLPIIKKHKNTGIQEQDNIEI